MEGTSPCGSGVYLFTIVCSRECLAGCHEVSSIVLSVKENGAWIKGNENDREENKS